ncbi:peptidyl-prolyl cis-trans isomerase, cyclophilin-type [Leptospira inadai serovar Lyme str. 10]|uniref:Peptidyl-prolyl cis-trans isomerase n=2 Tax=Leptospira inadai serovar Lyme TaxID=293084 RepID=V6HC07_9LEPT|nr:peptidylprolyl isomerase [Leptospira inadai]EQA37067.1 peptidyl-prolyl cis-trans isomerase, cyclophilin-type [Leptospira inadai serovar Lyme str. 10]PNV76553.1 peptidylprolyl isomerase [Leptospira inadai serovar Lyme]
MNRLLLISLLSIVVIGACKNNPYSEQKYRPEPYTVAQVMVHRLDQNYLGLPDKPGIYAVIQTSQGDLVAELFDKDAPKTVQNFIDLAQGEKEFTARNGQKQKKPFYDGLTFHRVIEGFMIQGGCPNGDGTGGPGYRFEDEINAKSLGLDKQRVGQVPYYTGQLQRVVIQEMGIKSMREFEDKKEEFEKNFEQAKNLSVMEVLYRLGYRYNEVVNSHRSIKGALAMANAGPNTNGSQFFINQVDTPHLDGLHTIFGQIVRGTEVVDKIVASGNSKSTIRHILIVDRRAVNP